MPFPAKDREALAPSAGKATVPPDAVMGAVRVTGVDPPMLSVRGVDELIISGLFWIVRPPLKTTFPPAAGLESVTFPAKVKIPGSSVAEPV